MEEYKKYVVFFNLFYSEIGDRLDYIETLWCNVISVEKVWEISGDVIMWPCLLLRISYIIKKWFEEKDVLKSLTKISHEHDFYIEH